MSTDASDELRACSRTNEICLSDLLYAYSDGNGNVAQVHTYHGVAYVDPDVRFDEFNGIRLAKIFISRSCKRAARLGLRHNANSFKSVFLGAFALNYKCAIEMLTALRGEENSVFSEHGCDALIDRTRRLNA